MQVTDTVRVIRSTPAERLAFFAAVLSIQPSNPDHDGTNGEPSITIGFIDPEKKAMLGSADWHKAFTRITEVRHVSHDAVQNCATEFCYTEVLPSDGGPVHIQGLEMEDLSNPPAEAADAPDTTGTVVYRNNSNGFLVGHLSKDTYVVCGSDGVAISETFSDLFSAKTYVDAQPKPGTSTATQKLVEAFLGYIKEPADSTVAPVPADISEDLKARDAALEEKAKQAQIDAAIAKAEDEGKGQPSSADLDAHAEESAAKEATAGEPENDYQRNIADMENEGSPAPTEAEAAASEPAAAEAPAATE